MSKPVVEVQVRAMAATSGGCAVFLGNEDKVFVMIVDQSIGTAITMFMQGTQKERPLTHDLLANILRAHGAKIERVIVNDFKRGTYFARLVLSAENESQQADAARGILHLRQTRRTSESRRSPPGLRAPITWPLKPHK
jgi:bifunctional DNase/RNase